MKPTEFNNEIEEKDTKINLLSSKELDTAIKNISRPRFLGSIHLNKDLNTNYNISSVDTLLKGELELKINKSLKNAILNPITKALIISMILFNLLWIFLFFIL